MSNDPIAYKVLTGEQLATLESGSFAGAPVDLADGYIHLSTAATYRSICPAKCLSTVSVNCASVDR